MLGALAFSFALGANYFRLKAKLKGLMALEAAFVESLFRAFSNQAVNDVHDLVHLYLAHFQSEQVNVETLRNLLLCLEKIQLRISASSLASEKILISRLGELRALQEQTLEALRQEKRRTPFYGIPEPERGYLEDILELTDVDRSIVSDKLTILGSMILARQQTIDKLSEEKGTAKKLAWLGLIGMLLFGTISVILGIAQLLSNK